MKTKDEIKDKYIECLKMFLKADTTAEQIKVETEIEILEWVLDNEVVE